MGSGDQLTGGSGADAFRFEGTSLGLGGAALPTIADFDGGEGDKLVFATGLEVGSFTYLESAAFTGGRDSEARFDEVAGRLEVDQNGDGAADQQVVLDGVSLAAQLSVGDFLWL